MVNRMAEYIEKQAVIMALKKHWNGMVLDVFDFIRNLPSADVPQIVRCRDCKYFEQDGPYDGWCHGWSGMIVDDGYCSFGERKDGDTDG